MISSRLRPRRDHPRVCGEHCERRSVLDWYRGSSPRVRGTQKLIGRSFAVIGIIPACAGNTCFQYQVYSCFWGSSPRVRGTRRGRRVHVRQRGIIPACAGNTSRCSKAWAASRDHPRVCGEHPIRAPTRTGSAGSSPRVRGTPVGNGLPRIDPGIIPACAGNTISPRFSRMLARDHPRVCGEHTACCAARSISPGSSPRVRGTRMRRHVMHAPPGIIPACAGNTSGFVSSATMARDHPRVCGEHPMETILTPRLLGSSPRVRGTPFQRSDFAYCSRDHPRVCGEHQEQPTRMGEAQGSSPRVRGTRVQRQPVSIGRGIIPACAGNTCHMVSSSVSAWDHPRVCGEHDAQGLSEYARRGSSPRVRGTPREAWP